MVLFLSEKNNTKNVFKLSIFSIEKINQKDMQAIFVILVCRFLTFRGEYPNDINKCISYYSGYLN